MLGIGVPRLSQTVSISPLGLRHREVLRLTWVRLLFTLLVVCLVSNVEYGERALGVAFYRLGNYEKARYFLGRCQANLSPRELLFLGNSNIKAGDDAAAERAYTQALVEKKSANLYYGRALTRAKQEHYEGAIVDLTLAIQSGGKNVVRALHGIQP